MRGLSAFFLFSMVCFFVAPGSGMASASSAYPVKPVRFIVPFSAGGGADLTARAIAQKLGDAWGKTLVVDNRPGGNGQIGVEVTATAVPDGYTIAIISASHAVAAASTPNLKVDISRDLQAISQATSLFYVLVVHPSLPVKSVKELIAYAKANPRKLNLGASGTGSMQHLAGELFQHLTGTEITHVPYRGGAAALTDLVGGQTQLQFAPLLSSRPHIEAGRLRPLAISTAKRSSVLPSLPTIAEAGVPGYDADQWYGFVTGSKVPKQLVALISSSVAGAVKSPEVAKHLGNEGSIPVGSNPDEFSKFLGAQVVKWRNLVRDAKLKFD